MSHVRRISDVASKMPTYLVLYDGVCNYSHHRITWALGHNLHLARDDPRVFHVAPRESVVGRFVLQHQPQHVRECDTVFFIEKRRRRTALQRLIPGLAGDSSGSGLEWDLIVSTKSKAVFRLMTLIDHQYYPYIGRFGYWFVPRPIGDWLYDRVMKPRYAKYGKADAPLKPNEEIKARLWTKVS